jgi:uncharacterized RDD family membrane protein YckC
MSQITVLNQGNVPMGPFTPAQVAEKLQSGEFSLDSLAHVEGLSQWTPLRDVLARVAAELPPTPPSVPDALPVAVQPVAPPAYSYAATMSPPPHLIYAGFWHRVAAHILDNLIVSVPFAILWFIAVISLVGVGVFSQASLQNGSQPHAPSAALIGTIIIAYLGLILGRFLAVWLYHAILESGPHQSTWGKRVLGLKVTSYTGQRISFGHATGRYFSTLVTNMTMGIGYLMVAFTDRKQALHDMIAGTLVVKQ